MDRVEGVSAMIERCIESIDRAVAISRTASWAYEEACLGGSDITRTDRYDTHVVASALRHIAIDDAKSCLAALTRARGGTEKRP
jgi:hypothetical protein